MSASERAQDTAGDDTPDAYLARLGEAGEGPHDIATAALMLSALDHPNERLAPFRAHLAELALGARMEAEFSATAERAAEAIAAVLAGRYGYEGDRIQYDAPGNADFIQVIERRRGLPVALGILYIHAARAAGHEASGLFAPGHFLMRIGVKGSEVFVDPFNGGAALDRERMTTPRLAASLFAEPAPGEPSPFEPVTDTEVLLRLLNNVKGRALKGRDVPRALVIAKRMTVIAPRRAGVWLDLGRLQEASGVLSAARAAFERAVAAAPQGDVLHNEAALALHALKRRLN
jgi:regulator of sirC expression with transglutaminase-like and TPR domain